MPCPDGVEIPTILRWDTYYTFYNIREWTREQYPKLRESEQLYRMWPVRGEVSLQSSGNQYAQRGRKKTEAKALNTCAHVVD